MPRAIAAPIREAIVARHLAGVSLPQIASELGLPWATVRTLWRRYRDRGAAELAPAYAGCGRRERRFPPALAEAAATPRRAHPGWGAGLIRPQLGAPFPAPPLPHERTVRRWLAEAGVAPTRRSPRPPDPPRATGPHVRWRLDACAQVRLADGSRVSWLAASDEATDALLGATVFPPWPLESGRPRGGADCLARVFRPLGAIRPVAGRQWIAVGIVGRAAARSGAGAAGAGRRAAVEPAASWSGQWRGRAGPWPRPALGRAGQGRQRASVADPPRLGADGPARNLSRHRRPKSADRRPRLGDAASADDPAREARPGEPRRVWAYLATQRWRRRGDQMGRISLSNRVIPVGRAWAGATVTVAFTRQPRRPTWIIRADDGTRRAADARPGAWPHPPADRRPSPLPPTQGGPTP